MRGTSLVISLALLCPTGAWAQARQSRPRVRCGRHLDSLGEARMCAYFAYKKADAEMSRIYVRLSSELSGSGGDARQQLRKAQSLWLAYREATCDSEASRVAGGSLHPLVRYSCLASVTGERTDRLKAYLKGLRNP